MLKNDIETIVLKAAKLIDSQYWPSQFEFFLEYKAKVKTDTFEEEIPSSIVLSSQLPQSNAIRMGMHELKKCSNAFHSVLAHEVGHMVMEWIAKWIVVINSKRS